MFNARYLASTVSLALAAALMGGCPFETPPEFVGGATDFQTTVAAEPAVSVLSPQSDLTVPGGTQIQVTYRAVAPSTAPTVTVFFDTDQNPLNGTEIVQFEGLPLSQTTQLLDTTELDAATYFVGVVIQDLTGVIAQGYAAGAVTINQAPRLLWNSPRNNVVFDRSERINPTIDVSWTVSDPDSTVAVDILLDPNPDLGGDEILLFESDNQTGDNFSFELRTAILPPGNYDIVAVVRDTVGIAPRVFSAPGGIRLRPRLAGFLDLRLLDDPASGRLTGAVLEGFNPGDNLGSFANGTRDIDRDGFDDIMAMAQFGKPRFQSNTSRQGVGEAYLIYGRQQRFTGRINANSVGTLLRGDIFEGPPQVDDPIRPSRGITSFDLLDDLDSDGVRDMVFGLPFTDSSAVGVPFTDGFLDSDGYFRTGVAIVAAGSVLRPELGFPGAGDIRQGTIGLGDIGALKNSANDCEACDFDDCCPQGHYGPKAFASDCAWTYFYENYFPTPTVGRGPNRLGARISTNVFNDQFAESVARYDLRGIIMSAPNRDPRIGTSLNRTLDRSLPGAGVVSMYLVPTGFSPWNTEFAPGAFDAFGYAGTPSQINLSLPNGGPYFYIIDDFDVYEADGILFSGSPGYVSNIDTTPPDCGLFVSDDICVPSQTVRFWSGEPGARLSDVQGLNDFNADGLLDLVIGAPFIEQGRGACFIVLGRIRELMASGELQVEELGLPSRDSTGVTRIFDGVRLLGAPGERLGQSQDDAEDFNGDGIADVVIGSPLTNDRRGGAAVFFGSREVINLTQREIPYEELDDRGLGVIFIGERDGDLAGARVAGVGDIDGDGFNDIMIAAPNRSVQLDLDDDGVIEIDRTNCGAVYLVYGSPTMRGEINLADIGTAALPGAMFIGANSGDFLGAGLGEQGDRAEGIGGAGDVDGDGQDDIIMSALAASPRNRVRAGEVYLIYGEAN